MRELALDKQAVALGTSSLWEGVDLEGASLKALVMTRLPFPVPTDPVVEARSELYEDGFGDYMVPEAVMRFRQGFGRLIRSGYRPRGVCHPGPPHHLPRLRQKIPKVLAAVHRTQDVIVEGWRTRRRLEPDWSHMTQAVAATDIGFSHPAVAAVAVAGGPIALGATLDGGQAFRWWQMEPDDESTFRGVIGDRLLCLSERDGAVEVVALDAGSMPDALEKTADYLGAGVDLGEFRQAFADDRCIGPAVRGYAGLRLLRQDPWECLVSYICSSTSNVPRIKLNVGSVAAAAGRRLGPAQTDFEFPTPSAIAALGEQRLRDLGLGFRARYVNIAAEMVACGDLNLMALRRSSYGDAKERLMSIHGVGEKIADCVLAFSLDKPEAFPVDRWTRRALEKWYGLSPRLNNTAAGGWARDHFGRYGAIAQQYMFHRERLAGRAASWGGAHNARALPEDVSG